MSDQLFVRESKELDGYNPRCLDGRVIGVRPEGLVVEDGLSRWLLPWSDDQLLRARKRHDTTTNEVRVTSEIRMVSGRDRARTASREEDLDAR